MLPPRALRPFQEWDVEQVLFPLRRLRPLSFLRWRGAVVGLGVVPFVQQDLDLALRLELFLKLEQPGPHEPPPLALAVDPLLPLALENDEDDEDGESDEQPALGAHFDTPRVTINRRIRTMK